MISWSCIRLNCSTCLNIIWSDYNWNDLVFLILLFIYDWFKLVLLVNWDWLRVHPLVIRLKLFKLCILHRDGHDLVFVVWLFLWPLMLFHRKLRILVDLSVVPTCTRFLTDCLQLGNLIDFV